MAPDRSIVDLPPQRFAECLDVLRAGFADVAAEFGLTRENTPSNPAFWEVGDLARVVAHPAQLFAIEMDGRLVGCAFVGPSRSFASTWVLRHLAVVPSARHQGLGEALVHEAASRAREDGARRLRIGIIAENTRLSDWYHRLGFTTVDSGQHYPGLLFAVDHLELPLA